jgi:hypothetical protein
MKLLLALTVFALALSIGSSPYIPAGLSVAVVGLAYLSLNSIYKQRRP